MTRVILLIIAIFSHCRWPVHSFQFVDSFALNPVSQIGVRRQRSSALPTRTILPRKDRNALRSSPDPVIESKMNGDDDELMSLKVELTAYLEKRKEVGADEVAKEQIGKVIGGTKGNKILDYVSVAPNKATVTEDSPNPFDYDELVKYGYGHLVTRIMNAGGRNRMYQLFDMTPPPVKTKVVKVAPPIVIDREGKDTRYQGLKLGQVLDDNIQAAALQDVQRKIEQGERVASSRVWDEVEAYEIPFADKRNTGPKQTPDWTVEQLDAWGKQQGRVESWARKARQGAYVNDPLESLDTLTLEQRLYSILTAFLTALSFGKATPNFALLLGKIVSSSSDGDNRILSEDAFAFLQIPAVLLLLLAIGSSIFCVVKAPEKNRSSSIWGMKGILGGPFAIQQLAASSTRITQQEQDDMRKQDSLIQP